MIDDKDAANRPGQAERLEWSLVLFATGCFGVATGFAIAMDGATATGGQFKFGATVFMAGFVLCVLSRICKALLHSDFKKLGSRHQNGLYNAACHDEASVHYGEETTGFSAFVSKVRSYLKGVMRP